MAWMAARSPSLLPALVALARCAKRKQKEGEGERGKGMLLDPPSPHFRKVEGKREGKRETAQFCLPARLGICQGNKHREKVHIGTIAPNISSDWFLIFSGGSLGQREVEPAPGLQSPPSPPSNSGSLSTPLGAQGGIGEY